MLEINPHIKIQNSPNFEDIYRSLAIQGGGSTNVDFSGPAVAGTNGTLGAFTVNYKGTLDVGKTGDWIFIGTVDFYDFWDFDPRGDGKGRSVIGEVKVRITNKVLPGKPFDVTSELLSAGQSSYDNLMTYPNYPSFSPQWVTDPFTKRWSPLLEKVYPLLEKWVR
jgi:hypothetical protein